MTAWDNVAENVRSILATVDDMSGDERAALPESVLYAIVELRGLLDELEEEGR